MHRFATRCARTRSPGPLAPHIVTPFLAIALVAALSGCVPLGPLMALGGLGGGGSKIPQSTMPGHPTPPPLPLDRSIPQALHAAQQSVMPQCTARLPSPMPDPPAPGACAQRPICFPGAGAPTAVLVCTPSETDDSLPTQHAAFDWDWRADGPPTDRLH